jgi:sphingomyelin phosphodiesterase
VQDRRFEASCEVVNGFGGSFGGDLEVVIRDKTESQPSAPGSLDLLAYNIWLRPWMLDGQKKRARLIGQCVGGHDVVVLVEAFHRWYTPPLLKALAGEYPHQSRVLGARSAPSPIGPGLKLWNGGVVVISKWPIEETGTSTFRGLLGMTDRMADKGVLYACVRKHGLRHHLFATHTQADPEAYIRPYYRLRGREPWAAFKAYRRSNLQVIRRAIDELDAPSSEPVLIVGDLNTDYLHEPAEHARMLELLNAGGCTEARGHPSTYCPRTNELASGPRDAWLDHVLWSRSHLQPQSWDAEIRLMRAPTPWRHWGKRYWDLSDHYGLHARLTFA